MDDAGNRQRDERGLFLPNPDPDDYTRYAMGDRDPGARAAKAAYKNERGAAARTVAAGREKLTVEIHFRVTEETAAAIDALIQGRGTRNTTARDILLEALEDGDGERETAKGKQRGSKR